jgi:tetratricopeptide (TPR) repeat protein
MRRLFVVLGALSLLALAPVAHAQDQNAAAAEVLFRDGRAAADQGDYKTACAKFHESNRLDPAVGTLFNIADCEEKLGHLATAWTSFKEVAQRLPSDDERRAIASQRSAALEPRLPRLRIRLGHGVPSGSRVRRDGVELGAASLDTDLPVDPGQHRIDVTMPGIVKQPHYEVFLAEGETKTAEVQLEADDALFPAKAETPPVAPPRSGTKTLGLVVGGVGLAAALTGVVTGILVLDRKQTVDQNCNADKLCNSQGLDAARSGKTLGIVTTVALATGAVGLGAGTYLVLSASSTKSSGMQTGIALGGAF